MNRFSEIHGVLQNHKAEVDKIIAQYRAETQKLNTDTFSESYIQKKRQAAIAEARSSFGVRQHLTALRISQILGDIQDELRRWVSAPALKDQMQLISMVLSSGMKLSQGELESLQSSCANNYFAQRLLAQAAQSAGISGISAPDLDSYTSLIAKVRLECELFIGSYCGSGANMTPEILNTTDFPNAQALAPAAADCRCLGANSAVTSASIIWDGTGVPCSHKISLTAEERKSLDAMFVGCSSDQARKERAAQICRDQPLMADVLRSQPGYRGLLPDGDGDVY